MTAVVIGATGGIGAACVAALTGEVDRLVTGDLHGADVTVDLATSSGRANAAEGIIAVCPDGIDQLVLAAGVGPTVSDPRLIPRINLYGTLDLLDALLPSLRRGSQPSAVLLSSHSAAMVGADHELVAVYAASDEEAADAATLEHDPAVAYAASKRALTMAMRQRVTAFSEAGVRLNAVAPGPVMTPLLDATLASEAYEAVTRALPVPLGRWARPDEIAAIVAFLAGPDSSIVQGAVWFADGGTDGLIRPGDF